MTPLELFRKDNDLTQMDVAEFLGNSSSAFISRIENGKGELSLKHLFALLENNRGWDTSSLLAMRSGMAPDLTDLSSGAKTLAEKNALIAKLQAKVESLEFQLAAVTSERDKYWKLIESKIK